MFIDIDGIICFSNKRIFERARENYKKNIHAYNIFYKRYQKKILKIFCLVQNGFKKYFGNSVKELEAILKRFHKPSEETRFVK